MRRSVHRRRGAVLVWSALSMMMFVALLGLGIDVAHVQISVHQLQNATDAIALAGARVARDCPEEECHDIVYEEMMRVAQENPIRGAVLYLEPNPTNDPAGDIVLGRYEQPDDENPGGFTPTMGEGRNAVRLTARRIAGHGEGAGGGQIELLFGGIFGVPGVNIVRTATATVGGGTGSGLLALGETGCGILMCGTVDVYVEDGEVQINSSGATSGPHAGCSLCTCGAGTGVIVDAPAIYTNGGDVCLPDANFSGDKVLNVPPAPDPLAGLPAPPIPAPAMSTQLSVSQGNTVDITPGYYPHGIVQTGGTLNLEPGIYIIGKPTSGAGSGGQTPAGLRISAGTTNAEGVMFYIHDGAVDIGGNANLTLTPPNPGDPDFHSFAGAGTYEHISIFQSRTNSYPATITGGPGLNIEGTLYFPENKLTLHGTGEGHFGNQIIAHSYEFYGNGDITITYKGTFPAPGNRLFLVE